MSKKCHPRLNHEGWISAREVVLASAFCLPDTELFPLNTGSGAVTNCHGVSPAPTALGGNPSSIQTMVFLVDFECSNESAGSR